MEKYSKLDCFKFLISTSSFDFCLIHARYALLKMLCAKYVLSGDSRVY